MNESIINPARSINTSLNQIRQEAVLTDLLFVCRRNDQSVVALPAHQFIFSALSSKLKSMLEIANEKQPYEQVLITIDSVDSTIMEKLVELIYEGETKINTDEKLELIDLCKLLQLDIPLSSATIEEIPYEDLNSCIKINDELNLQREIHQKDWNGFSELATLVKSEPINEATRITDTLNTNINSPVDKTLAIEYSKEMKYEFAHNQVKRLNNRNIKKKRPIIEGSSLVNDCDDSVANNFQPQGAYHHNILQCKFCGVTPKYHLNHHVGLVHDKINRFNCAKCSYSSYLLANMKSHIKGVHDQTEHFKCNKCEYTTVWKYNLTKHNLNKHADTNHL